MIMGAARGAPRASITGQGKRGIEGSKCHMPETTQMSITVLVCRTAIKITMPAILRSGAGES